MYNISKPRHIISSLLVCRSFLYAGDYDLHTESGRKPEAVQKALREQFSIHDQAIVVCHRLAGSHSHPVLGVTEWDADGSCPPGC